MAGNSQGSHKKSDVKLLLSGQINDTQLAKQVSKIETSVLKGVQKFVLRRWQKIREIRSQIVIWFSLLATVLLALGLQIFFSQQSYRELILTEGGTYREGVVGKINSLNPLYAMSAAEKAASYLLFSRLLSYDLSGGLQNDLAKSVVVSNDGLTYSVALRDDVLWHDGKKLTAKDVKFTVELMQNPLVRSNVSTAWRGVKVIQISDFSLDFVLPAVYAPFRSALTFAILPEHILGKIEPARLRESDFASSPIGSGVLSFQNLRVANNNDNQKQILHLIPNQKHYSGISKLNRFELHAFTNETTLLKAAQNHEIAAIAGFNLDSAMTLDGWKIRELPLPKASIAFLNNDRPYLKQVAVRQALRAAIDLDALRSESSLGLDIHQSLDYPILPEQLGQQKFPVQNWFDEVQAVNQLESLGYKKNDDVWLDTDGQKISFTLATIKNASYSRLAEKLAERWREFGIEIELKDADLSDPNINFVRDILQPRNYDILVYEIDFGLDADQFVYWHSSQKHSNGLNQANYANSTVDTLLTTARTTSDIALRQAKYQSFLQKWLDDAPAIILLRSNFIYAFDKNINTLSGGGNLAVPEARYAKFSNFLVNRHFVYTTP